jgi:hypothetical protein
MGTGTGPGFVFKSVYTYNNIKIIMYYFKKLTIPSKTSVQAHFRGWRGWWWWAVAESYQPPLKTSIKSSFSRMEVVVVMPRSNHPRKQAYAACFRGWCGGGGANE